MLEPGLSRYTLLVSVHDFQDLGEDDRRYHALLTVLGAPPVLRREAEASGPTPARAVSLAAEILFGQ